MVLLESALAFARDPQKMLIVVSSFIAAVFTILAWKRYNHSSLLYAHLLFTISPLFYFALSINCSLGVAKGLLSWCTLALTKAFIYLIPPTMAISFIAGAALIPKAYQKMGKALHSKSFTQLCKKTGITASLYLIDSAKPLAFSTQKTVFVSVGMFELMNKKELEAVILHELYHVKSKASWNKFSSRFVQFFSPIAWFSSYSVEKEEIAADAFAVAVQGTREFLMSAKNKAD